MLFSQKNVMRLPLDSNYIPSNQYFMYFLPQTAFKVIVTVEKNEQIKGYYADYADKMLGISNVFTENKTNYIISKVDIQSYIIPDSNLQFLVEMSHTQIKSGFYLQMLNNCIKTFETKHYGVKEGLPNLNINTIFIDSKLSVFLNFIRLLR